VPYKLIDCFDLDWDRMKKWVRAENNSALDKESQGLWAKK
jgi:hypothetical protein